MIGRIGRQEAWATSRDSRAASVDVVFIENAARRRIDFDELASCIETVGPDVNTGRAASPRRFQLSTESVVLELLNLRCRAGAHCTK